MSVLSDRIGILLVNNNQKELMVEVLEQIEAWDDNRILTLILDNACNQNEAVKRELGKLNGETVYAASDEKLMLAGAYNLLAAKAKQGGCNYYWIWDGVRKVKKQAVDEYLNAFNKNGTLAAVNSMVVKTGLTRGGFFYHQGMIGKQLEGVVNEKLDWVDNKGVMIKAKIFDDLNGFDTAYYHGFETIDFFYRMYLAGHEVTVINSPLLYLIEARKMSPLAIYFGTRNPLLFAIKNFSKPKAALMIMTHSLLSMPKEIFKLIRQKKFWELKRLVAGWWDGIKLLNGQ